MTIKRPSPHYGSRKGVAIDCIVMHADAGTSEESTLSWLANKEAGVSYHYLIGRTGTVYQCVSVDRRAWHAGVSNFEGRSNVNDFSIGVSFANNQKGETFPAVQMDAGVKLVARLCCRYSIPTTRITTHAIIAPKRKTDPGSLFSLVSFVDLVQQNLLMED